MNRFETEKEARRCAKRESEGGQVRYVIESPGKTADTIAAGRFVVDSDGFTRSWERTIAEYEDGKELARE